jgi:adenine phosphoribosyltransferase
MANVESIAVHTIGTSYGQSFFVSDYERSRIRGKKVAIVDEVVGTGATIQALRDFVSICDGAVEDVLCIATEGQDRADVKALIHLPIFSAS